ncbi:alpha/beta hydrolase [Streptomyces sp. NPDC002490]|uniref:alpha/beta fold hydrolase n=1 Tax=Streptomyces sp. NPDC002490 TaxID=3154416 RepID=UPI00331D0052
MIECEVRGSGEHHVIALHGWFGDRTSWSPLWPHLNEDEFTYAFVDLRGFGASRHLSGEYDFAEVSRDVRAVADRLGWDAFSLIGASMGGKAALRTLADTPDRVRAVVGIAPIAASAVPLEADARRFLADSTHDPGARRAIIAGGTGRPLSGRWLDAMTARSVERSTPEAYAGYLAAWSDGDFHGELAGLSTPSLAIAGGRDTTAPPEYLEATWSRHLTDARLETLSDHGHYLIDEAPLTVLSLVEDFLGTVAPGR